MAAFSDKNTPSSSTGRSYPTRKGQARRQKNEAQHAAFEEDRNYYTKRTNPNKGRFGGK